MGTWHKRECGKKNGVEGMALCLLVTFLGLADSAVLIRYFSESQFLDFSVIPYSQPITMP